VGESLSEIRVRIAQIEHDGGLSMCQWARLGIWSCLCT